MLMWLALAPTGEVVGLEGEDRKEAKPLVMIYMPEMYNNQPDCSIWDPIQYSYGYNKKS